MSDTPAAATATDPTAAPAPYESDIFVTWRVLGPPADGGTREPAGWVATDAVRTFGLVDGDAAWTENDDLIGYHFGVIDDGTVAVKEALPTDLPPLPIGPNADPAATIAAPDPADAEFAGFAETVSMFVGHGRGKLAEARGAAPVEPPLAAAEPAAAAAPATPPVQ